MKSVSNKFKNEIKKYGRQIDTIITYTDSEGEHLLDSDVLFSITPTVNGNILKSVMKQLDFESSIKVPKDTTINVKFGVQIDLSLTVAEVNAMMVSRLNSLPVKYLSSNLKGFEYINLGNYIVSEEAEYNADTQSYSHICYDKMLYSMKDYEKLDITYPITIREYINKICEYLGLTFRNKNNTFVNYDKQIKLDLYDGYDYTFRDVLDELAQVTASTICINESYDELEIRYINDTKDTIDEDYLKDTNVGFSEKYGPINSIVLSRSAESDNVYLQDENSISINGLCELKIIDNQIMNDNDRSDFLLDILAKLDGLEYYINDFSSPGITWYELCDKYTVKIEDNLYNCVLFNDEIRITQGLEETIYTEMPETSETDYSKADKTDRKINKAYIIVDKQNQRIEALISQTDENTEKLSQHEQTIDSMKDTLKSQETKIEAVENKADNAQSTADSATTKANNAQTSANTANTNAQNAQNTADTATTKADNAQATANTANTKAQNAQNKANENATKITTNTTKIAEVEKTVDGITQSVSKVEEKVETVENKADNAQSTADTATTKANNAQATANTAKSTADNTKNNLATNYYEKTEMDTKFTQTADNIELLAEEIDTITGDNSIKNGDFKNQLNNWSTSVSNGDIAIVDYNNKKYANLTCRNGNTILTQRIGGLFAGIEYTLKFDIFDNGEVLDISDCGTLSVEISQDKENSEEIINVLQKTIDVAKTEQTISLKFTLTQNSKDVLINFKLSLGSYSAFDISAMITNVILSGGSVTEKFSKINVGLDNIESTVSKKVGEDEFGTLIEQNIEAIKIAWNQISQYLKLEGLNGQVSLNIYDSSNNLLMSLDCNGQKYYKDSELIGKIGTNRLAEDNSKKSLDFDLDVDGNFMTWASKNSSSDQYYYWKWTYTKGGISTAQNEGLYAGADIYTNLHKIFLNSKTYIQDCTIYHSMDGNNGFWICVDGEGRLNIDNNGIYVEGNVYSNNSTSDGRLKENIKESTINALDIIKEMAVRSFDWKKDKKHINAGFIAQEMEIIDDNFVLKNPIKDNEGNIIDNKYYINELPIIATLTKGIQEQQKEIEELKCIAEKQKIYIEKILEKLNIEEQVEDITVLKDKKSKAKNKIKQYKDEIKENTNFKEGKPIQIKMIKENNSIKLIKETLEKEVNK